MGGSRVGGARQALTLIRRWIGVPETVSRRVCACADDIENVRVCTRT